MNQSDDTSGNESVLPKKKPATAMWFALILLTTIAGGGFYLWQKLNNSLTGQQHQLTQLQLQVREMETRVQAHNQQIMAAEKNVQALRDMAQQAMDLGNRQQKGWLLAEADYLMRMANRRLQISRDIPGAMAALQGANQSLHETGDISLLPVRQQLAKELAALKALPQTDIDGIALTLDQMCTLVYGLPFRPVTDDIREQLPESANPDITAEKNLSDKIIDAIMAIGDIKIHQRSVQPVRSEQQQYQTEYLLLNHLVSARLSALRFDAKQFVYDISLAQQILNKYYDIQDTRVAQMSKELAGFSRIELVPALPDITASWNRLQVARSKTVEIQK